MKVLNVNTMLDVVAGGGSAERTFQLTRFLARAGTECSVLTLDIGLTHERCAALEGASVTALHCLQRRFYLFALPEPRIRELVGWADIVHLMGHWTLLNALVHRELMRQRKPYVVCPAGALPIFGRSKTLKSIYNRMVGTRLVRGAGGWVAIGTNEFEHFGSYGVDRAQVRLIPNGVDPGDFPRTDPEAFRQRFGLPPAYVLFVGRLNRIKGPDLLLEAFAGIAAAMPDLHLVYAGPDGGMLTGLRADAAAAGLAGRVHFVGAVHGPDKVSAYRGSALLAVPSRQEAMSIVALEAGACGTPVLITDQCGFDEVGASGGGLVTGASAAALRSGLEAMLSGSADLRAMGERLRRLTLEHYLWSTAASRYCALFEDVLAAWTGV